MGAAVAIGVSISLRCSVDSCFSAALTFTKETEWFLLSSDSMKGSLDSFLNALFCCRISAGGSARREMTKGESTRQWIIEQAAPLFNQRGFEGCSMQDVLEATGLEKGGVYRHFESKEELAAEVFRY